MAKIVAHSYSVMLALFYFDYYQKCELVLPHSSLAFELQEIYTVFKEM